MCVGPGGVGKTTTAAALGALAARQGRRTLVCTIDPAPRLADALGVGALGPEPRAVPPEACRALGIEGEGRYFAVRLDTARAFAALVEEQVAGRRRCAPRIFANPIYRQITTTLTGSQEYAATLALYELATHGAYDLIVLDTPPTANALDFLEAPRGSRPRCRARRCSGSRGPSSGRALLAAAAALGRRAGDAAAGQVRGQPVPRRHRRVPGRLPGRAGRVSSRAPPRSIGCCAAPTSPSCWCWRPRWPAVDEALYFHARLREAAIPLGGFVANRVHPAPGLDDAAALGAALRARPETRGVPDAAIEEVAARLGLAARAPAETRCTRPSGASSRAWPRARPASP